MRKSLVGWGSDNKKAMVQPVRIICPEFGIADIEETGHESGVNFVVFDDQAPKDHNGADEPVGTCIVNCTAKDFSKLTEYAQGVVWGLLEWNLDDAGSVAPVYDDRNPENPHQQTIRYPGMPDHNDGFGPKSLALRFKDRTEWTTLHPLELRFNRDGTSAADQHYATLDNVEAGNPNWYVYWQQVANQFSHPVSGTFGPQTTMVYGGDAGTLEGKYRAFFPPYHDHIKLGVFRFVQVVHHENGHRQTRQLPPSLGGWNPDNTEFDTESNDWQTNPVYVGQQDQDGDGINDAFETNLIGEAFSVENTPEARSRDQDAWMERAHRTGWDETPGAGLSFRNEDHVLQRMNEIRERDWSYHDY